MDPGLTFFIIVGLIFVSGCLVSCIFNCLSNMCKKKSVKQPVSQTKKAPPKVNATTEKTGTNTAQPIASNTVKQTEKKEELWSTGVNASTEISPPPSYTSQEIDESFEIPLRVNRLSLRLANEPKETTQTRPRTVAIIGALSDTIREELVDRYPELFGVCVPHTSRQPRKNEVAGRDYHFVDRAQMEDDVKKGLFIECGEFEGNLYGTTFGSVDKVGRQGRHCLLDLSNDSLRRFCADPDTRPIIVFIRPSSIEDLRDFDRISEAKARAELVACERIERTCKDILQYARTIEYDFTELRHQVLLKIDIESDPEICAKERTRRV